MTAKLFIRTALVFVLIHLVGHTIGHLGWDNETGPFFGVIKQMKSHSAEFMGATKSMADFFEGYSLILIGLLTTTIILLWILSNNTLSNTKLVKQLLLIIAFAFMVLGITEWVYFFPLAAIISFCAALSMFLSIFKLNNYKI